MSRNAPCLQPPLRRVCMLFWSDGRTHGCLLASCFGRAIVGPCIALAASISVTGLGVSSLTRSGLWEPHSPGGRFAVILSPSMQRNPLDQGRRPGSPLELCFFICIHRRQVGLRIQPPCQKLSWIDHWGLRLQSSLLVTGWPSHASINWAHFHSCR